ncbi:DUF2891 domain-containing protein [Sphingomonas sanguinis]|uniref:DUF2891 domain-containing protein n=1 Tax=Sphingomonas sp. LC-1 TaxID=3110957 RepID=UPI0021BB31D1|nr:DUF2891 domain-containing protein [Sphingomonas sp. LC-1]MCT8003409.1 DUF2891 domain-containing protein [Sphingomonas sp. LC-1]
MTPELAARFARIALGHVTREYPHKADHVYVGDDDRYIPRLVHPIFYGSFDWHSCVHGYWLLARIRRLYPAIAEIAAIDALFAEAFTAEKVGAERAYLDRPDARGFERPYGWAWLLMLASELTVSDSPYAATLRPLAEAFAARWRDYLPMLTYPVRVGSHANTAFALVLIDRYARVTGDEALRSLMTERARAWFGRDRAAQAWEPSGQDFLSPVLIEAFAMRALLPRQEFASWFAAFLPDLGEGQPEALFTPARVSDRSDGQIAHLDGLNLSRAWTMRGLAPELPEPAAGLLKDSAARHIDAALHAVAGDYMGEHWLASFATLAMTGLD